MNGRYASSRTSTCSECGRTAPACQPSAMNHSTSSVPAIARCLRPLNNVPCLACPPVLSNHKGTKVTKFFTCLLQDLLCLTLCTLWLSSHSRTSINSFVRKVQKQIIIIFSFSAFFLFLSLFFVPFFLLLFLSFFFSSLSNSSPLQGAATPYGRNGYSL